MRKGYNPNKDQKLENSPYSHQVIIPVYIPSIKDYFNDSLLILQTCIESILNTCHKNTFITLVDNGSCDDVVKYLYHLKKNNKIQELITTSNIGKINAVLKGASGHSIPLVTITDADVLFLDNWQNETIKIFNSLPKTGVVGLIPQFLTYQYNCENLLFNNFFKKNLKFEKVKDKEAMADFYESIGWDDTYPSQRLANILCFNYKNTRACVGTGHVVSTFRREILDNIKFRSDFKMGGDSEAFLDQLPSRLGYYSFTTYSNNAHHMGNVFEDWMLRNNSSRKKNVPEEIDLPAPPHKPNYILWSLKNKVIRYLFKKRKIRMIFLGFKGLNKETRKAF